MTLYFLNDVANDTELTQKSKMTSLSSVVIVSLKSESVGN